MERRHGARMRRVGPPQQGVSAVPVYELKVRPLVKDGDYPHMQVRDVEIWERFIDAYGGNFTGVAYDVALGGVVVEDRTVDESVKLAYRYATAVKLDAVLFDAEDAFAVEVKPRASLGAFGQAFGGALLFEIDGSLVRKVFSVVVTDRASPDIKFVCEEVGTILFEVGDATPPGAAWLKPEFPGARAGRELRQGGTLRRPADGDADGS